MEMILSIQRVYNANIIYYRIMTVRGTYGANPENCLTTPKLEKIMVCFYLLRLFKLNFINCAQVFIIWLSNVIQKIIYTIPIVLTSSFNLYLDPAVSFLDVYPTSA